jgi:hypothetical protein
MWAINHRKIVVRMNYWEIIADRLSAFGWLWGCVSTMELNRDPSL